MFNEQIKNSRIFIKEKTYLFWNIPHS